MADAGRLSRRLHSLTLEPLMSRMLKILPVLCTAFALTTAVACNSTPDAPTSPSTSPRSGEEAAPDGSTLKVNAPTPLSPINAERLNNRQPTMVLANTQGRFVNRPFSYEFQLFDSGGNVLRSAIVAGGTGTTSWAYPEQLESDTAYTWRARAAYDGAFGPWSASAGFLTARAAANCGPMPIAADRTACIVTVAAMSDEWPRCAQGSGVACHRFTQEVARALAVGDPNWGLLGKPPGTWQCTINACGPLGGEGFGEDVVVYCLAPTCGIVARPDGRNDWVAIDIILGAGAPGAAIQWGPIPVRDNRGNNYWVPVP
jgi:hypothetical protein